MFKVGEKLKVVLPLEPHLRLGEEHVVHSVSEDSITLVGIDGDWWHYRFERVTTCPVTRHKEEYRALHRAEDPVTSKGNRKVNKYEQAVLDALGADSPFSMDKRGYTGKELAHHTGHPLNCITPRFAPLRRKGLIKAKTNPIPAFTDQVIKRDKQIVWVLV